MEITRKIIAYIQKENISIKDLSRRTGVAEDVLSENAVRALNASEFLEVCNYLKKDPYDFWEDLDRKQE